MSGTRRLMAATVLVLLLVAGLLTRSDPEQQTRAFLFIIAVALCFLIDLEGRG